MEEPEASECPTIPRREHGALRAELLPHLPLDGKWEYYELFSCKSRPRSTGFGEVTRSSFCFIASDLFDG